MQEKILSHKNVMYSRIPRIKSYINKGFFVVSLFGIYYNNIYYNGHFIGKENKQTGTLMIKWSALKRAGYIDNNVQ